MNDKIKKNSRNGASQILGDFIWQFCFLLKSLTMPKLVTSVLINNMKAIALKTQWKAVRYLCSKVFAEGREIEDEEIQELIIPMLKLMKSKE